MIYFKIITFHADIGPKKRRKINSMNLFFIQIKINGSKGAKLYPF